MLNKAVVLCGGMATRFLPISKSIAKEMLPILNRPAIDYCIQDLRKNGVKDILIVLGRNKEIIEDYYDRNIELEQKLSDNGKFEQLEILNKIYDDINISFVRQIYTKGTGYAVQKAKNFVGNEPFLVIYPDDIVWGESYVKQMVDAYEEMNTSIIPLKKIDIKDSKKYGMVDVEEESEGLKIINFIEKPEPEDSPSDLCYLGSGLFTSEIFDYLENCKEHSNGEIYLTDAFYGLMRKGLLYGIMMMGERIDLGNPLGLLKGNIIAGLSDSKYRDELLDFIKDIVNQES